MKHCSIRLLSALLVLAMLLSTFTMVSFAAQKNQGTRHELCTALSSQAEAYYTGAYSPDMLVSYKRDDSGNCLTAVDSELYKELQTLMTDTHTYDVDYKEDNGLQEYWPNTDCIQGGEKPVLFYSDVYGNFNREHVWPKSRASFYQSEGGSDLHHLRPTNSTVNSKRSNYMFGNVRQELDVYTPYPESGEAVIWHNGSYTEDLPEELPNEKLGMVEVNDNIKGDVARILLYVYTRWEEKNLFLNDPNAQPGTPSDENNGMRVMKDLDTLLQWCAMDPVDTWEMGRNDATQAVQGNRNVFIDYPELAWLLFGEVPPADLEIPEPLPLNLTSYSITASSNNNDWGTVSLSGRRITATPAEGYFVEGYTVVSGTATVIRNGNMFTVKAESDCTVRIDFAAKTPVTVSFNGAAASIRGYAGEPVILPEGAQEEGYHFIGWVSQPVAETEVKPEFYAVGDEYIPTESVSLYALYSFIGGSGEEGWALVTDASALTAGAQLVIASNTKGVVAGRLSSSYLTEVKLSFEEPTFVAAMPEDALLLTLGGVEGAWTLANQDGQLLGATGLKNLAWNNGTTTWTITMSGNNVILYSTNTAYGRMLHNSGATRFTTYDSNVSTSMLYPQLYVNGGGCLMYTTELTRCEHGNTTFTEATAATCTAEGNPAYYTCTACGRTFSDAACTEPLSSAQLVISALGHEPDKYEGDAQTHWQLCSRCGEICTEAESHDWDKGSVTQEPTEDQDGVTTYTCELCSATYTEAIPALGQKLRASFSVPQGVEAVPTIYAYAGETISLPETAGLPGEEYSFLGWIPEILDDQTTVGTYYKAGQNFVLEESISFKALYQYAVQQPDSPEVWSLLTDTAELEAGAKLVLAHSDKGKVAGPVSSQYLKPLSATFSADHTTIRTLPTDAMILTLGGEVGAWTLANAEGQLLGATAVKKLAWDTGSTTWTITVEDGDAIVYNTTASYGRFLYNSGSPRFTTYASAANSDMLLPQLYILSGGSTVYYTTEFGTDTEEPEVPTEPTVDESITLGHSLNLASDISINYAVRTALLEKYDSYHLECVLPVYEGNTLTGSKTVHIQPVLKGSYYYFTLTGVTAVNMNDTITATLYMEQDGVSFRSNSEEYSVAKYAYAQLAKTDVADKLKALCANLLRYGAAAQSFKSYRTDALVDQTMTAEDRAFLTDLDTVSFGNYNRDLGDLNAPVVLWVGKSLLLDSKVTLRYVFNAANYSGSVEELSLRVTYKDYKGETKTATVTGAQPYGTVAGRYSFDFDGLLAAELRSVLHAAVYAGETQVSNTLEYSVDTYGNNKEGTLGTLCKALIAYSDVALAYFA
ncbi:MAG: endonuclease [Oscillospiraceae bacterium]|nr:endonuclease [Oscillospiraceae bacterium]